MNNNEVPCITKAESTAELQSFRDIVQTISTRPELSSNRRRDIISAVKRIAGLMSPAGLDGPADLAEINLRLSTMTPAMAMMQKQTFANMKSLVRAAFKLTGRPVEPGKRITAFPPEWVAALSLVSDSWACRRLKRFAHFAAGQGWQPSEVKTEHMLGFLNMLETNSLQRSPRTTYHRLCKTWNDLAENLSNWPGKPVEIIRKRDPYMVSLEALSAPLQAEINAFLAYMNGESCDQNHDGPVFLRGITRKPCAPTTIALRRTQLLQYISALVSQGHPVESLRSVHDITATAAITTAMDFFYKRAGNQIATQISLIAEAVQRLLIFHLTGGSRTTKVTDARIDLLKRIICQSRRTDRGLSIKNKRCLAQLDVPRNLRALLNLPEQLLQAAKVTSGVPSARLAESALAIELLLMCPIRVGNLVGINLQQHLLKSQPGEKRVSHLVIPEDEVKNKRPIEFKLPPHLASMLERHITVFRPQLPGSNTPYLFPATNKTTARSYKSMEVQLTRHIRQKIGLVITPHQFRHIAGKLFLDRHPTGHETVRQVLGHASIDTTTHHYTGLDQMKAVQTFDKCILALRQETKFMRKRGEL